MEKENKKKIFNSLTITAICNFIASLCFGFVYFSMKDVIFLIVSIVLLLSSLFIFILRKNKY
jgi:VIT1/CCC1 family predicted Fe2+/Mn2+ transporter